AGGVPEGRNVLEPFGIERAHRAEREEIEPHRAEMDAGHGPAGESRGPERAAVAHALRQDAPGVGQRSAVLPRGLRHLAEVVRLLAAAAAPREATPLPPGETHVS